MPDVLKSRRIARIFLSTGFILASGAYAFWYHLIRLDAVAPAPNFQVASRSLPQRLPLPPKTSLSPDLEGTGPLTPRVTPKSTPLGRTGSNTAKPPVLTKGPQHPPTSAVQPAATDSVAAATIPPAPLPAAHYMDGEFTGDSVESYYGPMQVKVTVLNGGIINADCPVYPIHFQRSEEISGWAIPMLITEVIKAQSADIDTVSGATQTSIGYYQSLVSALEKAKK